MKMVPHLLAALLFTSTCTTFAAERPKTSNQSRKEPAKASQWNVRVEVMMVAMPQDRAMALLPDLRTPDKIAGSVKEILGAIERKEATLLGWPVVCTLDGQRAVTETILEQRYPVEFDSPFVSGSESTASKTPETIVGKPAPEAVPTSFETRNTGATLEVDAAVYSNGELITLSLAPQRVALLDFKSFGTARTQAGHEGKIDQPLFFTTKTTTTVTVRNGQYFFLGIHKLTQPENQIELHILQATATPIK
jgi:hypothetical protein